MKRGTKLYLVSPVGETIGPYPWPLVRDFHGLNLIPDNAWVCVAGEETWKPLYEFSDLQTYPIGQQRLIEEFKSAARPRRAATGLQHSYLRVLLCPFASECLDFDLALHVALRLAETFPHLRSLAVENEISPPAPSYPDWNVEPATEKQIDYLIGLGVEFDPAITKRQASDLIDAKLRGVSDAQKRRLNFFNLPIPKTKREASVLIDAYLAARPGAEARYQQWKDDNGIF